MQSHRMFAKGFCATSKNEIYNRTKIADSLHMLDRDGFRPNVGMIVLNTRHQVFWGKRYKTDSWQFPQGGVLRGESLTQAMYRELNEEVGLSSEHVEILGRTKCWLHYQVPEKYIRQGSIYKGQKQIWFLLRLVCHDSAFSLRNNERPEFDAWRWNDYWQTLDQVIDFKRDVYRSALKELSVHLPVALREEALQLTL